MVLEQAVLLIFRNNGEKMDNQYKILISNKNIYKEVVFPTDQKAYSVGTAIDCDFRLRKEIFFEELCLDFMFDGEKWAVICSDNIYISVGDTRKLLTINLEHGMEFVVKYQESNNKVFDVEFQVAFENKKKKYDRKINIKDVSNLKIGTDVGCSIVLKSNYLSNDIFELIKDKNGIILNNIQTTCGIYHNGKKIDKKEFINSGDFFSIADFSFYYCNDTIHTEASEFCIVNGLPVKDYKEKNNYPQFTRNTRIKKKVDDTDIEILDPPSKPNKPKNNLLLSMLSSMGMLLSAGAMAIIGGGRMIVMSLISAGMAIVTTVVTLVQNKKEYKNESAERVKKYNLYIDKKRQSVEEIRKQERDLLNDIYLSKDRKLELLNDFSGDLFDRCKNDDDFLNIRIGTGDIEAARKINYKKQEKLEIDDFLQELPENLSKEYKMVHDAPICCSLRDINALGIIGLEKLRYEFLKNMIVDISIRHYYTDVKLFLILSDGHEEIADIFRLSPFFNNCIPNARNIVCDDDSKKQVFEFLYNTLSNRGTREGDGQFDTHYVIFFFDLCEITKHPLSKFIDKAKNLGVTFVFFDETKINIPMGCDQIIVLNSECEAKIINVENNLTTDFKYENYSDASVENIVRILAPIKTDEISLEGSLTKNINLFKLLNIFGVDDLDYKERWSSTQVYKSMAVPLGVSKTGTVDLDLHDKAHGPHGLVAGTTGSGKSEILQTYILSIATYFHPYEVAFVIIDFKGGGMVNQFRDLPHLLGAITNIDGKEIDRSLKSIKAELQKRQRLFAEAEVNHIDHYIHKYKNGETNVPLPHLIIIVDEFAELKAEQPDFMKELISAARIGRSLGVHLILATQKPAGQVDEQIWSNSRFKLCLKVQGPEDSNEVLKSPLAAEIKEPGRAYLQVGNNEIFELFQSAYSGALEKDVDNYVKSFSVSEVDRAGRRTVIYEQKNQINDKEGRTQLEAIVESVKQFCDNNNIKRLSSICLPSLEKNIVYSEERRDHKGDLIDIGIYDDPDNQYQGNATIDIYNKNTFIIGSAQYGKTNLLQLIIRELVESSTVDQTNIYILDFGSMVLKQFEKLKHVGGVVCSSDDEKLKNLFKLLMAELSLRKEKIVSVGVSSFSSYCEAGYTDLSHIYIFVDNMTALMELYLENDDTFLTIIREGVSVGVTTIVANSQTSGMSYKYLSNFPNKIALYCNDSSEYYNVFERPRIQPDDIPGRVVIEMEKRFLECQTYLAFSGEKEFERSKEISEFIKRINLKNGDNHAKRIPYIPDILTNSTMRREFMAKFQGYNLPIGLSYSEVLPVYMNFANMGSIGLCGKPNKGHYNFVSNLLNQLEQSKDTYPSKVYIFDDVTKKFRDLKNREIVKKYTMDVTEIDNVLMGCTALLEDRYNSLLMDEEPFDNELLVLIIQNNDIAQYLQGNNVLLSLYNDIVGKYKALNVCVIFTNFVNATLSYDAPEPLKQIKTNRHMICFDDLDNLKVFDVNYEDIRANRKKLVMGDAFYINDNNVTKLKLIKADN